nr:MAG TPA: hypothetical protein [Caudoviricetes sp.]
MMLYSQILILYLIHRVTKLAKNQYSSRLIMHYSGS